MKQYTIDELQIGQSAQQQKTITEQDVALFGEVSNDYNPLHFNEAYAKETMFKKRIAHGMLVGSLFSKLLGQDLPGEGTVYLSQSLVFKRPVFLGDTITATITLKELNTERNRALFDCECRNQHNTVVILGEANVMPPVKKEEADE